MAKKKQAKNAIKVKKPSKAKGKSAKIWVFVISILIVLFLVCMVLHFLKSDKTETKDQNGVVVTEKEAPKPNDTTESVVNTEENETVELKEVTKEGIQGSWLSISAGTVLTMEKDNYRIDFSGVEGSEPITGTYELSKGVIKLYSTSNHCKDEIGKYKVNFVGKNIRF